MPEWKNVIKISPRKYICGYCGNDISSEKGFSSDEYWELIYICHHCQKPTYFSSNSQFPGPLIGSKIQNVPMDIEALYDEARKSFSVLAFTASVMACRKLIMHIAVQKGAKEGLNFQQYVEYLNSQHFIPPDGKEWVDHIRAKGNEANHEIVIMKKGDAEDLITFIEMLLKFIYEFPSRVKAKQQKAQP
jgi:hypothetical protein